MKIFEKTEEEYRDGCEANIGICLDCGEDVDEFYEPDRRGGHCWVCGGNNVCGYEWALVCGQIEFSDDE